MKKSALIALAAVSILGLMTACGTTTDNDNNGNTVTTDNTTVTTVSENVIQ